MILKTKNRLTEAAVSGDMQILITIVLLLISIGLVVIFKDKVTTWFGMIIKSLDSQFEILA